MHELYICLVSKTNLRNIWTKFQKGISPLLGGGGTQKPEWGIPLKDIRTQVLELEEKAYPLPSKVPSPSTLLQIVLASGFFPLSLSSLPFLPAKTHFQDPTGRRKQVRACLLPNPWRLLTRREKRSCLEKVLPGAAEATAIRRGPNGQGWWRATRVAGRAEGGQAKAATCQDALRPRWHSWGGFGRESEDKR